MNLLNLNFLTLSPYKKATILLFVCLLSTSIFAQRTQRSVRIGYIDTEYILENITEYANANSQLEAKVQEWKGEIEKRLTALEDQKKQLNNERILLTNELISEREEDLQIIENEIIEYQQKRFGPNGDLMIQKKQLIQPIQDQIFAAVQELAASKKYDFIFDKSADVVMLYSADRYDISEQVLRTINRSSNRTQAKSKKERKAAKEEETIVVVDSGKDERQKLLDERKAERELLQAEKLQKKLDAREARKKEIEAKRQKALEDRAKTRAKKTQSSATDSRIDNPNETESTEKLDPREARKKELDAKRKKALEDRAKKKSKKTATQTTTASDTPKVLSEREIRKKALEEKKKQSLEARKARLEAQKKTRDSIRNN